jgi:DNA-binding response OmpR family regulator
MSAGVAFVVEDNEDISRLIRFLLERDQFVVRLAVDGREGKRLIDELAAPELVILDIMLPYLDGFQLLQEIRRNEHWKRVPVIMLTAKNQERDIVRALDAGANDYVAKPFQPEEFMARVRRVTKACGQ